MSSWQVRSHDRPEHSKDEDAIVHAVTLGDVSRRYDEQERSGRRGNRWRDLSPERKRLYLNAVERAYGYIDLARAIEDAMKEETNAERND